MSLFRGAAIHGDLAKLNQLLAGNGALLNAQDTAGMTALVFAARCGQDAVIERLLELGAALELRDNRWGLTALHAASGGNMASSVGLLLGTGAAINALDARGQTPLITAAMNASNAVIERLMAAGPDLELRDAQGMTALNKACYQNTAPCLALLLDTSASPHTRCAPGLNRLPEDAAGPCRRRARSRRDMQ